MKEDRVLAWLADGAQPSEFANILQKLCLGRNSTIQILKIIFLSRLMYGYVISKSHYCNCEALDNKSEALTIKIEDTPEFFEYHPDLDPKVMLVVYGRMHHL